jgi:hypothetical protein
MCVWFKTYTVLHDNRKWCKNVSLLFWGQGAKFQNVFGDGSIKVAHCKKIFKTFVF